MDKASRIIFSILKLQMKKIAIAGPTGAGKTTLFKLVFPYNEYNLNEVERNITREALSEISITQIEEDQFENSTTTVSFNVSNAVACIDLANRMNIYEMKNDLNFLLENDFDYILPIQIIDIAGQDRFRFMVETMIRGSSGVIFVADGTNVSSINRLPEFREIVHQEELRINRKIESIAFVNKSDMAKRNLYVGSGPARSALPEDVEVFETTMFDKDTYLYPIRKLIVKMFEKHLTSEDLRNHVKKMSSLQRT